MFVCCVGQVRGPGWRELLRDRLRPMLLSNLSHPDCNDTLIRLSRHGHPAVVSASMDLLLALFQERSLLCARMRDVKVRGGVLCGVRWCDVWVCCVM